MRNAGLPREAFTFLLICTVILWAYLRSPGQYTCTTTFDVQTLEIVSIASKVFNWTIDPSGRNGKIDTVIEQRRLDMTHIYVIVT